MTSWLEEPDRRTSWEAQYEPYAVEGDRAVAVGSADTSPPTTSPSALSQRVPHALRRRGPMRRVPRVLHARRMRRDPDARDGGPARRVSSSGDEVGDRVWVRRYASLDQTIGVVGGAAGLAVIDTRATHRLADELRDELPQLPGAVAAVVNTHGHWDHAFGNARFLPAPIWGHVRCAAMIVERGAEVRDRAQARRTRPRPWDEVGAHAADRAVRRVRDPRPGRPPGRAAPPRPRPHRQRHRGDWFRTHRSCSPATCSRSAGPGFGDSYPIAWAQTGRVLLDLVEGVVVPGHGDPFDRASPNARSAELGCWRELRARWPAARIGLDEAIRRSPFAADTTGKALNRARLELTE